MTREERAALRRATWAAGVAHTPEDAEAADLAFWAAATPAQRLQAVAELVAEYWTLHHPDEHPPRLDRSVCGVRRAPR